MNIERIEIPLPNELQMLLHVVEGVLPALRVKVDAPDEESGRWFAFLTHDGHEVDVEWRPGNAFGITSSTDEPGYGNGPDETYADWSQAAARVANLFVFRKRTAPNSSRITVDRNPHEASAMNPGNWSIERVEICLPELPICIGELVTSYYGDSWEVIGLDEAGDGLDEAGDGNRWNSFSPDDAGTKGGPQTVTVKRGAKTEKVPASTVRSFRGDDRRTPSFFLRATFVEGLKTEVLEAGTLEDMREILKESGLVKDIEEALRLGEQICRAFFGVS